MIGQRGSFGRAMVVVIAFEGGKLTAIALLTQW